MAYRKRRNRRAKNLKKRLIVISLSFIILIPLAVFAVSAIVLASASKDLSKIAKGPSVLPAQTSKIYAYDAKGTPQLLTNLFFDQDRVIVPLSYIPTKFRQAVISIEDERFYVHRGVDFKAITRAVFVDIKAGKAAEGASTITQQYVKNAFLTSDKTVERKLKEAVLAYELEKILTKDQILEKYLNTIYFGQSAYGIETAAHTFFGKQAKDLTLAEGALLAGIIRIPNAYSPYTNPEKAKMRRDLVLTKMFEKGYIAKNEFEATIKQPIVLVPQKPKNIPAAYFVEYVKQQLIDKYGTNMVFKGGLRVYTTIDQNMQSSAENSVKKVLNRAGDPSASLVSVDPRNGYIKAMVGGTDFNVQKFNLAVQSKRQPGSAFKPFVLAAALEKGVSVSKGYASSPVRIKMPGKDWSVRNATEGSGGRSMNLREAMAKSVNAVFARLIMEVGPEKVVAVAKKMGITSPVDPFPSIALGGLRVGVSSLEMASAYATFANNGSHHKPVAIVKVTDSSGKVLEEHKPAPVQAVNPTTAYLVTDILKNVIRGGTGRAASIGRPAAGKTGTTQNYGDAWFVGYTPHLSTSVWIGYSDSKKPMKNVHGIRVAGGTFPAQIWRLFMNEALSGLPRIDFVRPKGGIYQVKLCVESNKKAGPYCPDTYVATFPNKQGPAGICDIHKTPPPVTVANFKGLSEKAAKDLAASLGLSLQLTFSITNQQAGMVLSQSPEAGVVIPKGSAVTLVITMLKPEYPRLMNVLNMSRNEAERELSKSGYIVFIKTKNVSDPGLVNKVIKQSPAAGTELKPGSQVTLTTGI